MERRAPKSRRPSRRFAGQAPQVRPRGPSARDPGNFYYTDYVKPGESRALVDWLTPLHLLWEQRYSTVRPLRAHETQRPLLRPVYWLGNWQFACLNYYHPPQGTLNRCVRAEPFPEVLAKIVERVEVLVRQKFPKESVPEKWHLNTCLVNFYGRRLENDRWVDLARVGDHRDHELGPVASLSFGERALFQFVESQGRHTAGKVISQVWLDDNSLQFFGGPYWKDTLFHRVQRVEKKGKTFPSTVEGFETRRINLTLRYVPEEHIVPYKELPEDLRADILPYMQELAIYSKHFAEALK